MFRCGYGYNEDKLARLEHRKLYYCNEEGQDLRVAKCYVRPDAQCEEDCVLFGGSANTRDFYCGGNLVSKNWVSGFKKKVKDYENAVERLKDRDIEIVQLKEKLMKERESVESLKRDLEKTAKRPVEKRKS